MCLMCAHTVIFLHDVEEGPRGLCFLSFVNTTPTRGEKLIFPQNVTKFWRTKWGGQVHFEIDQIPGVCLKTFLLILKFFRRVKTL